MADKVRDVMLLTVPTLKDDQDDPIVEPDVLIKDDGWDKRFVKAYLHDEIPWMDMHDEVFDLMCLAAPSLAQLPADQLVFSDPEIPEDGLEAGWLVESEAPAECSEKEEFKATVESAFARAAEEAAALNRALDELAADAEFKAAIDAAVSKAVEEAVALAVAEDVAAAEATETVTLAVAAPAAQAMIAAPASVGMIGMPEPVPALAHSEVGMIAAPEADEEFDAAVAMAVSKAVEQVVALIRAIDQAPAEAVVEAEPETRVEDIVAEIPEEVHVELPETVEEVVEVPETTFETEQVPEADEIVLQEPEVMAESFEVPAAEEINVIPSVPETPAEALVATDTVTESMPTVRFSFGSQEVRRSGWRVCFSF